jgi:uncharacterized protein YndB with AHSA1/START domain
VTEIRVDVDLAHPPERVWRVLTELHLVMGWLPTDNFVVTEDGRFSFRTELEGLDEQINGQTVTFDKPTKLVMRWEGPNLHTLLSVALQPTDAGCRMTVAQRGFLGAQGTLRGRALQRTYTQLLEGPMVEALDRLASSDAPPSRVEPRVDPPSRNAGRAFERSRSNSAPGLTSHVRAAAGPTETPGMPGFAAAVFNAQAARGSAAVPVAGPSRRGRFVRLFRWLRRAGRSEERRSQAVAAAAALLLLLAMLALLVGRATIRHPAHPPQTGGGTDAPFDATSPVAPMRTDGDPGHRPPPPSFAVVATATPTAIPTGAAQDAPVLVATYKTERKRLSGYDASITIANSSSSPVDDWSVTVTLPVLDLRIRNVDGAVYATTGQDVTFTPVDSTRTVSPGTPVQLRFQVDGLGKPVSCMIDGTACVGLPE